MVLAVVLSYEAKSDIHRDSFQKFPKDKKKRELSNGNTASTVSSLAKRTQKQDH